MNLLDLTDKLRWATGWPDIASSFKDSRLQEYRDAINQACDEIQSAMSPNSFALTQQSTFTLVSGTPTYAVSDWAQRILSVYSVDTNYTYQLNYIRPQNADRSGIRNPNIQSVGRYAYTDGMRTATPAVSGDAGSGAGATVTEGATTIAFGSSGTVLTSALIGRMIRLNGEDNDYKVLTVPSGHSVTVDKPVKARLRGDGTTNIGAGYMNVRWEIGPSGRLTIQILPAPTETRTLMVRSQTLARRLIGDTDTPEIQTEYHHLIWKRALRMVGASKQNADMYQIFTQEAEEALALFRKGDVDDVASTDSPRMERLSDQSYIGAAPYGSYSRGEGFGPSGVASW